MAVQKRKSAYFAEITREQEIGTIISLFYKDDQDSSRNIIASIAPDLGSNLFRFQIGEQNLIYCQRELLIQKAFTGNFVLWPFPNRVRDKHYTYKGQEYSLEAVRRPSGNAVLIHGLVVDRVWIFDQPVITPEAVSVTTSVEITEKSPFYASYPFNSRLSLTYTLTRNGITITYLVENTGNKELPFGFALHPYFSALSGKGETLVSIPGKVVMEADNDLLPTGRLLDVDTIMYAMFDLRQPIPVNTLKLDHVYTELNNQQSAIIEYKKQGLSLQISASKDFTHCVIYTAGKEEPFFCIEYQTCSTDAINLHNQGPERREIAHLLEVHPGETKAGSLDYTVIFH